MRQSKKKLLQRISELEAELRHERNLNKVSAFVNEANLPKCKSQACAGCRHIVYKRVTGFCDPVILGCGKDLECKDYEESPIARPNITEEALRLLHINL